MGLIGEKGKGIMNNKKNLKMKPVGSEYMEQYNALLRYVFQVTEQELSSIGWQEREIIRAKFPTMEKADVIGWFDDDNLVSQVAVYPMQTRIFGRTYAMGGLTGVGTYPEYSNMGLMHKFHSILPPQGMGDHLRQNLLRDQRLSASEEPSGPG